MREKACPQVAEFRSTRQTLPHRLDVRKIGSLHEKWHDCWRSLFPGSQPPNSPYIHGDFRDAAEVVRVPALTGLRTAGGTGGEALPGPI
jgi:hypothetical protein